MKNKSGPPPRNIPIRTRVVSAYIFRKKAGEIQFLLLKRKSPYMFGLWQQVAGRIEKGETAPQAVLREIKEETGLIPTALYSADIVEIFYEDNHKCIHIIPVFAAVADPKANVVLSDEHSDCKWVSASHAKKYVTFVQQKSSIDIVNKEFALKKPPEELRIRVT
ncbi:MAG: NUDIX domain-containing protein [candidate division Zixibacteria bacterium]|jgi:dATP pyrophosphohydrolase|nr:NUDIX domain-containing protein [candidate division Zixibacteria bacterium]